MGYSRVSDPPTVGSSTICVWSGSRAYYGSAGRNRKTRQNGIDGKSWHEQWRDGNALDRVGRIGMV